MCNVRRLVIECAKVGAVLDRSYEHRNRLARVLQQIAAIQFQRPLVHPHQRGLNIFCYCRRRLRCNNQIATADVQLRDPAPASLKAAQRPPPDRHPT